MLDLCFINVGLQGDIVKTKLHPCLCISKSCSVESDFSKMGPNKPVFLLALCCVLVLRRHCKAACKNNPASLLCGALGSMCNKSPGVTCH